MFWHLCRRVTFVGGIRSVLRIGIGIRTDNVDASGKRSFGFNLHAARTNFTTFNREERTCRIGHQVIGFGQLIEGTGNHNRTIVGYVFHTSFVLFTFRRSKNITACASLRGWLKRFAIAEIRRYTIIEQVVNTTAPGKLFIISGTLRRGNTVQRILFRPVITTPQSNQHFIPLRLVLYVKTSLFLFIQHLIST